jgi:hypothetical protein
LTRQRKEGRVADTFMQYVDEDRGIHARWWGGAYIEFGYVDEHGEWHAHDVINVYDYAKGETSIPFTPQAMAEAIEERLSDDEDDE